MLTAATRYIFYTDIRSPTLFTIFITRNNIPLALTCSIPLAKKAIAFQMQRQFRNMLKFKKQWKPSVSYVQVAHKVFKSKSQDPVVGLGGAITLKDMTRPQLSREELQTELIAAKKQNEDLTNHVETIQEENTELKSCMGLVEAEMKMLKDTFLKQFNATFF